MLALFASIALVGSIPPGCPFTSQADRQLLKLTKQCGDSVTGQSPLRVRIGNLLPGTLYTFYREGEHDFASWLFVGKRKFVIHDNPEEAGWFGPVSIFNVRRNDGYCIVILRANGANYLGDHPADERPYYDGLVSCLKNGRVTLDQKLSKAL